MTHRVEATSRFKKEFGKLDKYTQRMLKAWIINNLVNCRNPRSRDNGLTANKKGQWRYRIGDYRIICQIDDDKLVILALTVGHRSKVYDS